MALAEQQRHGVLPASRWLLSINATVEQPDADGDVTERQWGLVYKLGRTRSGAVVSRLAKRTLGDGAELGHSACCELTPAACAAIAHDAAASMQLQTRAFEEVSRAIINFSLKDGEGFDWEREIVVDIEASSLRQERNDALTAAVLSGVESCLGMYRSLRFDIADL